MSSAIADNAERAETSGDKTDATTDTALLGSIATSLAPGERIHHVKWIAYADASTPKTPIVTQNENGPCPLLAIVNVLLLRGQVSAERFRDQEFLFDAYRLQMQLEATTEVVSSQQLLERLFDVVLKLKPRHLTASATSAESDNYDKNLSDAMLHMHRLMTGIDVNVRFHSCVVCN